MNLKYKEESDIITSLFSDFDVVTRLVITNDPPPMTAMENGKFTDPELNFKIRYGGLIARDITFFYKNIKFAFSIFSLDIIRMSNIPAVSILGVLRIIKDNDDPIYVPLYVRNNAFSIKTYCGKHCDPTEAYSLAKTGIALFASFEKQFNSISK